MICPACEMGVVENSRCVACGHRLKPTAPAGPPEPPPVPTTDPNPTVESAVPVGDEDPRSLLQRAYNEATAAAEAVNQAHNEYGRRRQIAEAAARKYLVMREAYVGGPARTEDMRAPANTGPQPRCRRCSEILPHPIPIRCGNCGAITASATSSKEARKCPTCGTPNPAGREECYACYHPMGG